MARDVMVALAVVERLERAQLEILALALFNDDGGTLDAPWRHTLPAIREKYRTEAHEIMQGQEPAIWQH